MAENASLLADIEGPFPDAFQPFRYLTRMTTKGRELPFTEQTEVSAPERRETTIFGDPCHRQSWLPNPESGHRKGVWVYLDTYRCPCAAQTIQQPVLRADNAFFLEIVIKVTDKRFDDPVDRLFRISSEKAHAQLTIEIYLENNITCPLI